MTATATPRFALLTRAATALLLTVIVFAGGAAVAPDEADAWYRAVAKGRPGKVAVPPVFAIDENFGPALSLVHDRGAVVRRSPATRGPQIVVATYTIQHWSGSDWRNVTTQTTPTYRIPRGSDAVRLAKLYRTPTTQRGYFRVLVNVSWGNARTGRLLGTTWLLPNRTSDFGCATRARPCASSDSWVRIGALRSRGGGW